MNKKYNRVILIMVLFLLSLGVSYAYFTAFIKGNEDINSIETETGVMYINYDGGTTINLLNIIPDDNPILMKTFTVTGYNNTTAVMSYKINLIIDENTFSNDALKYTLISTNINNNGKPTPNINDLTSINNELIFLGEAEFYNTDDEAKLHTYSLLIYFPKLNNTQNINQGKMLKAYIEVTN